jgi:hypothetical protein
MASVLTKKERKNVEDNTARNAELQKIKNLQEEIEKLEDASMTERLNNLRKEKDEKCYDQQLLLLKKEEELKNFQRVWKFKNLTKKSRKRSSTKSRKRRGTKSPKRRSTKSRKSRGTKKLI